jgi:hypothetical protein|tara:strand:+ start:487 stop:1143 length:657 start_codon:yes stop_codon:yes gene_type:complete
MKSNEMVNQIKTLLNIEVKLEKMKLENGTVIEAESFEKGKEIFIITDDESVALPTGEYILEDSRLLVIEEEGLIADVREVSDEVPEKEETEDLVDDEMAEEDDMAEDKEMAEVGDLEGMEKRIQNLEDAIADLKKDKVEASDDASTLKSRTVKEEFKEEIKEEIQKEVEEKLSTEPAANPIKHNPEGKESKEMKFSYSPNRIETSLDRILNKINNIKK